MGSVQVTEAGRSDQTRATKTVPTSEAFVNENASRSPDQNVYEPFPARCSVVNSTGVRVGERCKNPKKDDTSLCAFHTWKDDNAEE